MAGSGRQAPHLPCLTLGRDAVRAAALALDGAERSREQICLISDQHPGMAMDDAYAIQAEWIHMKRTAGDAVSGWKIGLTSRAMQSALSIDTPDSGVLLKSMAFENGVRIPAHRFIQPRVEAEIAFVMKDDVRAQDLSRDAILAATDFLVPVLEILDTRIWRKDPVSGRLRTVLDTIADNAANGGYVLGDSFSGFHDVDLSWIGAIVSRDGVVEETGLGAGVLGDPLLSVAWLTERIAAYGGRIEAGHVILSGSFIRPVEAPPGSHIRADFGGLGIVECHFE